MTSICNYRLRKCALSFGVLAISLSQIADLGAADSADGKLFTQDPTVAESLVPGKTQKTEKPKRSDTSKDELTGGPKAEWIWGASTDSNYTFQTQFEGGSKSAKLIASCDNRMTVFINGKKSRSRNRMAIRRPS